LENAIMTEVTLRNAFTITLTIAAVCLLAPARPASAQSPDITGTWTLTVTMAQGTQRTAALALKNDAGKLVGTLSREQGDLPVEATVKEKAVTMAFTVPTQSGPLNVVLIGTAEGDAGRAARSMSGTVDLGSEGKGQWTATRPAAAQSATVDVNGAWAFAVETGAGTGTPTMTFKQDGEKLTGQYIGQLGEAPLTGTLKGTAIEFTIDLTFQGNAVRIQYAGTVEKGSMKGTAKFGDLGERTFTATKKP
jgi:hypothetical protein